MVDSVWQRDTFVFVMWKLFESRKVFVALLFPDFLLTRGTGSIIHWVLLLMCPVCKQWHTFIRATLSQ